VTTSPGARWLLVLVPIAVVAVLEVLSDSLLDEALPFPRDTILVVLALSAFGIAFGWVAFGRIDALTGTLRARNEELEARGASARALHRVSLAIASLSDVEDVLAAVVEHARQLLGADVAMLLLEGPDGRLEPRAMAPADPAHPVDRRVAAPRNRLAGGAAAPTGDLVSSAAPGASGEPRAGDPAAAMLAFVAPALAVVRLAAPLQRGGTTIGLLAVGCATARGFDADEVETLASLANQATIALEHARLEARLRELAVVEERERIARELHDGIAQVLGYVNTKSQAVDEYLAAGRVPEARAQVADLGAAARAVYVDVRESILGLRGPIQPGQGLGAAVLAYASRAADASTFALEASVDPVARDLRLDPDAEVHVYRVVQEALTNVRKHAAASRVRVSMTVRDGVLSLRVEDDGRGLASTAGTGSVPHYGLRAMRERAAAIGAQLEVGEGPGRRGTAVSLRLSLAGHRAEAVDGRADPIAAPAPAHGPAPEPTPAAGER
jgi:signal transduction histidine kinase